MHIFMTLGFTVAERVLYVPSVGYCLVLGMILDHLIPAAKNEVSDSTSVDGHIYPSSDSSSADEDPSNDTNTTKATPKKSRPSLIRTYLVTIITLIIALLYFDKFATCCMYVIT